MKFWKQVVRRRVAPIYRHPDLVECSEDGEFKETNAYIAPADFGSITDGDDRKWSGDRSVLEGGGGWRDLRTEF